MDLCSDERYSISGVISHGLLFSRIRLDCFNHVGGTSLAPNFRRDTNTGALSYKVGRCAPKAFWFWYPANTNSARQNGRTPHHQRLELRSELFRAVLYMRAKYWDNGRLLLVDTAQIVGDAPLVGYRPCITAHVFFLPIGLLFFGRVSCSSVTKNKIFGARRSVPQQFNDSTPTKFGN